MEGGHESTHRATHRPCLHCPNGHLHTSSTTQSTPPRTPYHTHTPADIIQSQGLNKRYWSTMPIPYCPCDKKYQFLFTHQQDTAPCHRLPNPLTHPCGQHPCGHTNTDAQRDTNLHTHSFRIQNFTPSCFNTPCLIRINVVKKAHAALTFCPTKSN